MRSRCLRVLAFACITLVLSGCAVTSSSGRLASTFGPSSDSVDPSFSFGFGVLSAMLAPQQAVDQSVDDWLLLGVKVAHDQQSDVWFVRLSRMSDDKFPIGPGPVDANPREFTVPFGMGRVKTNEKFKATVARILIETFDHQGAPLRSSIRTVPEPVVATSLFDLWEDVPRLDGSTFQQPQADQSDVAAMMLSLQTIGGSRAVRPIRDAVREHVVKQPKFLGLLFSGFRIAVEPDFSESEIVRTDEWPAAPRYQVDFPLLLTGQCLMNCRTVVGPPAQPHAILGGTLLFEAVHPDKPSNRLTIRVLASQRRAADHAFATLPQS